jgi:hypothetical protein
MTDQIKKNPNSNDYDIRLPEALHRETPYQVWPDVQMMIDGSIGIDGSKYRFSRISEENDKKTGCPTLFVHFKVNPIDINVTTGKVSIGS